MNQVKLSFYRLSPYAQIPVFGSEYATCFDLRYCPGPQQTWVDGYNQYNTPIRASIYHPDKSFYISPGERMLVPTSLIMRIDPIPHIVSDNGKGEVVAVVDNNPKRYSIRVHARSGLSLKQGLVLANAEGVIDLDYQKEIFVILTNISNVAQQIHLNDRIAQAEVVRNEQFLLCEIPVAPEGWGNRDGGFGSTGVK